MPTIRNIILLIYLALAYPAFAMAAAISTENARSVASEPASPTATGQGLTPNELDTTYQSSVAPESATESSSETPGGSAIEAKPLQVVLSANERVQIIEEITLAGSTGQTITARLYFPNQPPSQPPNQLEESLLEPPIENTPNLTDEESVVETAPAANPFPVIFFSPRLGSSPKAYADLGSDWAENGYVVFLINHSEERFGAKRPTRENAIAQRLKDFSVALLASYNLEDQIPALRGLADSSRIGISGDNTGAVAASWHAGARFDTQSDLIDTSQIGAVLMLSPAGIGKEFSETSWKDMTVPMMVVTGTNEEVPNNNPDWRIDPWRLGPKKYNHLLYIRGFKSSANGARRNANTYKARVGKLDYEILVTVSLEFWDTYLKGMATAKKALEENEIGELSNNRARIETR